MPIYLKFFLALKGTGFSYVQKSIDPNVCGFYSKDSTLTGASTRLT